MPNTLPQRRSWQPEEDYDERDRWLDDEDGGDRWRKHAACRDQDPALFFPIELKLVRAATETSEAVYTEEEPAYPPADVKAICDRCPVAGQCLKQYMDEDYGIYGGTTGYQRALLTKKIKRKQCVRCQSTDVVKNANQKKELCLACGVSWDVL